MRHFLLISVLLGTYGLPPAVAGGNPPNIVYILADDLGYGDLGCYGQDKIRTPRLDRMAREGMRFTDHYAGAPLCAPARSVFATGLHTGHTRIRHNRPKVPLQPEDWTIFEEMKEAGYATGVFGKWGLGNHDTTGAPWRKGVDEFLGYVDQSEAHFYYPEEIDHNDRRLKLPDNENGGRGTYSHDVIADGALDFIRKHQDEPFFLYVPFTIPHAEVLVPEDSLQEYRGRWEETPYPGAHYAGQPEPRAARAGMITRMDRDVGRILDLLHELGLAENTLIIFTSDNGPAKAGGQEPDFFASSGPLRGLKFRLTEGGIRVPFIAWWPGRIKGGATSSLISAQWDMYPTFVELAGRSAPEGLDGVSMVPTLLGRPQRQKNHDYLYWEYSGAQAVRIGEWKALRAAVGKPVQLYDLEADIGEMRDVASAHPRLVAQVERIMTQAHVDSPDFPLARDDQ